MKKRYLVLACGILLSIGLAFSSFSGRGQEDIIEPTFQKQNEIPPHSDNEEDLTKEVLEKTKKLSEEFVFYLAALNPEAPNAHLDKVRPITSDDVYMVLDTSLRKPTAESHRRVVKEVLANPVDDILPNRKKWNVIAVCDVYDEKGNKRVEKMSYWISIAMDNQKEWKITGFKVGEL